MLLNQDRICCVGKFVIHLRGKGLFIFILAFFKDLENRSTFILEFFKDMILYELYLI